MRLCCVHFQYHFSKRWRRKRCLVAHRIKYLFQTKKKNWIMKPHRLVQVMMEPTEIIQKKKATFKIHCMCWVDVCFYFIILQTDRWRIKQASLRFERKMMHLLVPDKFSASHSRELPFFFAKSLTVDSLWCWTVKKI